MPSSNVPSVIGALPCTSWIQVSEGATASQSRDVGELDSRVQAISPGRAGRQTIPRSPGFVRPHGRAGIQESGLESVNEDAAGLRGRVPLRRTEDGGQPLHCRDRPLRHVESLVSAQLGIEEAACIGCGDPARAAIRGLRFNVASVPSTAALAGFAAQAPIAAAGARPAVMRMWSSICSG